MRRIALTLLAAAAVAVFFAAQPDAAGPLAAAEILADLNADRAESAPQQQVVNGWAIRDLLEISIEQEEHNSNRLAALLVIAVLAAAVWGSTAQRQGPLGHQR